MDNPSESKNVERLVGLCKLWGAIKYFHPYLAYRDINWDAALTAALPKVRAAKETRDYAEAVEEMLAALGDPVTRVLGGENPDPPRTEPPPHEKQPVFRFTPDNILVVTIHYYQDLDDIVPASWQLGAIKAEIPKAAGVLFDLRAAAPRFEHEKGNLADTFYLSNISAFLSTTPFATAGQRTRMHQGLTPQASGFGFPYTASFQVVDGRRITPDPAARNIPVVFLINQWSELPPEALALQIAEKAVIAADGGSSETSLSVKTFQIPLSDGLTAEMRLGELISADGSGELRPDLIIPAELSAEAGDPALAAALACLRDFHPGQIQRTPLPVHTAPAPDSAYPEMESPLVEYRLLAAFRIWAAIHYFFPYKNLMDTDWDDVLRAFIPKMEAAETALSYHLTAAEMISHIGDSHGGVYSPVLQREFAHQFGPAVPPVGVQLIENALVITAIFDADAACAAGVNCGDILLKIDGKDAMKQIEQCARYRAGSTPQSRLHRAALASLSGPEDSLAVLTLRSRNHEIKEVTLSRKAAYGSWGRMGVSQRTGDVVRLLTKIIGYADLDRLAGEAVDEMFETLKQTKAIIFDMRGFPETTAWAIAPRLAKAEKVPAALIRFPFVTTPDPAETISHTFYQHIPPTDKWRYPGKTVMLIDERAISRPEHTGLFFEAANGTKFIGSPTSGTNGDITNFNLPGGMLVIFTGVGIWHADGRQLQRIGLVPDVEIRPTTTGIQTGRDEVLEGAVAYLRSVL